MNFKVITKSRWMGLVKESIRNWMEDKALRLSAALAYYSIFSIAPLLVITIGVAGLVFGQEAVSGQLHGELRGYVGTKAAETLQSMVQSAAKPAHGVLATVLGFATLLLGASGMFAQLKDALNTIWEVKPKRGKGVMAFLRGRLLNFGMVLVVGFLLLVSLVLSAAVAGLNHRIEDFLALPTLVWAAIAFFISLAVVTLLFAMIFKVLPDAKIAWRDVWVGAVITALLFEGGKMGLSWYLGRESTASTFGVAGSVVLLLLWVYYTSAILFFGAEFTQVYAQSGGRAIEPSANAERATVEDRAQQGLGIGLQPAMAETGTETTADNGDQPADGTVPASFLQRLMAPFMKYLEARGTLLTIEAHEALHHVISLGIGLAVAVVAIFAGWLLVVTALVGWLMTYFEWSWVKAAGITGGAHILIAVATGLVMLRHLHKIRWFPDTLNELKKDRTWLLKIPKKN